MRVLKLYLKSNLQLKDSLTMKKIIIYAVMLLVSVAASASNSSLERWDLGNKAYKDGDSKGAVEEYSAILEGGEYSADLYFNLANAYFKQEMIGKAILYYNKALRIAPSDDDIRHNLSMAEAQTKDRIIAIPEFFLSRWMRTMRSAMSCTAWSVLSLLSFALTLMFGIIFLLASGIKARKMGFFCAMCMGLLFVASTLFAISSRSMMLNHDEAVVMSSAISVKSSPDRSATDLFVLHEGTKVDILSQMDDWCEISIADGKKGWCEAKHVEEI